MNSLRIAISTTFACIVFGLPGTRAADLYDNLTQPLAVNGNFSNASWPALSFRTTAVHVFLDSVTIPIRNPNLLTSGTINFLLYDATGAGGAPGATIGAALGSVPISGISSGSYQNVTFSGLNRTLSANTNYYVAVQAVGLTSAYFVGATSSTGGTITGSQGFSTSNDSGATWSAPSNSLFVIGRVTAVPEPSTYLLCGLGVGVMALVARRKTRKVAA